MATKKKRVKKVDGRTSNGGARDGAGRKPIYTKDTRPVSTTVSAIPPIFKAVRKRHGTLRKALEYAAFNGGKEPK